MSRRKKRRSKKLIRIPISSQRLFFLPFFLSLFFRRLCPLVASLSTHLADMPEPSAVSEDVEVRQVHRAAALRGRRARRTDGALGDGGG